MTKGESMMPYLFYLIIYLLRFTAQVLKVCRTPGHMSYVRHKSIILVELSKKIRPIAQVIIEIRSRHTVVCRVAQENRAHKRSEYIDRNNKVPIFTHLYLRDGLSKWHQIYSGVSLHEGEATFQILTRSLKLFPRYESAKFRKNFFVFFFFVISHTLQKSP